MTGEAVGHSTNYVELVASTKLNSVLAMSCDPRELVLSRHGVCSVLYGLSGVMAARPVKSYDSVLSDPSKCQENELSHITRLEDYVD